MTNFLLSAAMVAVFALIYAAIRMWMREGMNKKPLLMIAAALVILANIVIWAVPDNQGNSLLREAAKTSNSGGAI
ncbi:MAG: hypothetical protein V3V15_08275 [Sphingorhabdus sp.]